MATERYNPRETETRWQKAWDAAALFETKNEDSREKYYVLEMFPLSIGTYPHGPCAQLYDGRRSRTHETGTRL